MTSRSSTTDPGAAHDVAVGSIRKPHGIRGEVVVESCSDAPDRFAPGEELTLELPGVPRRTVTIRSSRPKGDVLLVAFEGVGDRNVAEELRGGTLTIARDRVAPAPEGTYYYFELLGCACYDRNAGRIGVVVEVLEDGGGILLEVDDGDAKFLLPFVEEHLTAVDVADGRIDFDLPEGLLGTCRSGS